MRRLLLIMSFSFAALYMQAQTAMADITGVWKGHFFQENFMNPGADDLAYTASIEIEQHGDDVTGTCTIVWYDSNMYWGKCSFNGNYENGKFTFTEFSLDDDHCKPGYSWCLKDVEAMIEYNPQTAQWMLSGNFKAHNGFAECSPGTLFFVKEGDI